MPAGQPMPLAASLTRLLEYLMLCEELGASAQKRYLREFSATPMTRHTMTLHERPRLARRRQFQPGDVVASVVSEQDQPIT